MSGLFEQSEKSNNILFAGIMALSILILCLSYVGENFKAWMTILFLLLLFSSVIYGFVSKNPEKAFLLGFLIWALIPVYAAVVGIIDGLFVMSLAVVIICWAFICGILSGSIGYLTTVAHLDKKCRIGYLVLSVILFFILFYISSVLFLFSAGDVF